MTVTDKVKRTLENLADELKENVEALKEDVSQIKERMKNLVSDGEASTPIRPAGPRAGHPIRDLQRRTNEMFDDLWRSSTHWDGWRPGTRPSRADDSDTGWPYVDIGENDDEVVVRAELPGVDRDDIEISFRNDRLTIRGHKTIEQEDRGRGCHRVECFQGSFIRTFPLPVEVDIDRADASFKKRVLIIRIPKTTPGEDRVRQIKVR